MTSVMSELLRLEMAGWESLCDGSGDDFYRRIMADDAVMVIADGTVLDREAVVESLRDAPAWSTYEIADERVVQAGPDAAALVYTGKATRPGDESPFVAAMSSVYVKQAGEWRLALYQQTPLIGR